MPADTYSPHCGAIEQGTGNNNNSWGTNLNGALTALDLGIAGWNTHAVTGGNLALDGVVPPAGQHPAVEMVQQFTGVLASNQTVTMPNVSKIWLVDNECSGAFTLKFKTTAGAVSTALAQGVQIVYCDGANGMFVLLSTSLRDVQWVGADGNIAAPGISFATEPGLGLRRVSAGVMALTVAGVDIITVSAAGVSLVPAGTEANSCAIRAPAGWYLEFGQAVTRAGDPNLLAAITETFTANTNGTATLLAVSSDLRNLGLEGSVIEGVGIFTGTTIVSVDSAVQITMSHIATNTATGGSVKAFPYGNGDGSSTFNVPDARGTVAAGRTNMGGSALTNLTTAGSGVNALSLTTQNASSQSITLGTSNLPPYTPSGTNNLSGTIKVNVPPLTGGTGALAGGQNYVSAAVLVNADYSGFTVTFAGNAQGGTSVPFSVAQPTRVRNVIIKR